MYSIIARNVNDAWVEAKSLLNAEGVKRPSRNGPMIEVPEPVCTHYTAPMERVLFDETRNANPFFHLMEGLWMLVGRRDVGWITQYNKNMRNYSDDGVVFHAAYGHRWRYHFDRDQISAVIQILEKDPASRRAIINMWDPRIDLYVPNGGPVPKDLPCNMTCVFSVRDEQLNMAVYNRSNDIVMGCYGANVVHMSMLQEYVALYLKVPVGWYEQVSYSWHAYVENWSKFTAGQTVDACTYLDPRECPWYDTRTQVRALPMNACNTPGEAFDHDLSTFFKPTLGTSLRVFDSPFMSQIAEPMRLAWYYHKQKDDDTAFRVLTYMPINNDWRCAAEAWLNRTAERRQKEEQA